MDPNASTKQNLINGNFAICWQRTLTKPSWSKITDQKSQIKMQVQTALGDCKLFPNRILDCQPANFHNKITFLCQTLIKTFHKICPRWRLSMLSLIAFSVNKSTQLLEHHFLTSVFGDWAVFHEILNGKIFLQSSSIVQENKI